MAQQSGTARIDLSRFPDIHFTFCGKPDEETFMDYLETFSSILRAEYEARRGRPTLRIMFEAMGDIDIEFEFIKRHARFLREREDQLRAVLRGSVVLVDSKLVKVAVNTLFALKPPVAPLRIHNSFAEAEEFWNSL